MRSYLVEMNVSEQLANDVLGTHSVRNSSCRQGESIRTDCGSWRATTLPPPSLPHRLDVTALGRIKIHASVFQRMKLIPTYRPNNLPSVHQVPWACAAR